MLTLYHAPRSRSSRILWLLEELGEPYEVKYVTIQHADGSGARDPNNVHPEGKVPALVHDGKIVMESSAICLYLTDSFPKAGLGPQVGDPKRADYLYWLFTGSGDLEPVLVARMTGSGDTPMQKHAHEQVMARITKALKAGDYLLGDKFSAADIMYASHMQFLRKEFPSDPVYDRYVERVSARPAFKRAQAKDAA
jgi:glutathione S-transferase